MTTIELDFETYQMIILDPTQVEWGNEKEEPEAPPPVASTSTATPAAAAVQTFKCTALYSYTVSQPINFNNFSPSHMINCKFLSGPK